MTLGPNEPPIQWVRGGSSPGIKQPWREADHSRPSTEIKNAWRCLYIYPYLSTLRQITDSRAVIMKSETNTDSRIRVFNTVNTMSTILSWFYPPLIPHNWSRNIHVNVILPLCEIWGFHGSEGSSRGPLERWYPTTTLHGVTTQKTSIRVSLKL